MLLINSNKINCVLVCTCTCAAITAVLSFHVYRGIITMHHSLHYVLGCSLRIARDIDKSIN